MNGQERFRVALDRRVPDVVPTYTGMIHPRTVYEVARVFSPGIPDVDIELENPPNEGVVELLNELRYLVHRELVIDGYIDFDYGLLFWGAGFENVDDRHFRTNFGKIYSRSSMGVTVPSEEPIISSIQELKALGPPGGDRLLFLDAPEELPVWRKRIIQEFTTGSEPKMVARVVRGVFGHAWELRSLTGILRDLRTNPDLARECFAWATEAVKSQIARANRHGITYCVIENDIQDKNQPFMSPADFREFIKPGLAEAVAFGHDLGMRIGLHACGNVWATIEDLIECGFESIHPLEPEADMALRKVKAAVGDRICLMGNIPSTALIESSPQEVEDLVVAAIADAAEGGGYILCDSPSAQLGSKPENVITMFQAAKKHGRYNERANGGD